MNSTVELNCMILRTGLGLDLILEQNLEVKERIEPSIGSETQNNINTKLKHHLHEFQS